MLLLNSYLDENNINEEKLKKQIEFNNLSKLEYASFKEKDKTIKNLDQNQNEQNVKFVIIFETFVKLKKSMKYNYSFGKEGRDINRNSNYQFVSKILEKEFENEDEFFAEQLYNKRKIAEFLTMIFTLIGIQYNY